MDSAPSFEHRREADLFEMVVAAESFANSIITSCLETSSRSMRSEKSIARMWVLLCEFNSARK